MKSPAVMLAEYSMVLLNAPPGTFSFRFPKFYRWHIEWWRRSSWSTELFEAGEWCKFFTWARSLKIEYVHAVTDAPSIPKTRRTTKKQPWSSRSWLLVILCWGVGRSKQSMICCLDLGIYVPHLSTGSTSVLRGLVVMVTLAVKRFSANRHNAPHTTDGQN